MEEAKIVTEGKNKHTGYEFKDEYVNSGFTLSGHEGVPHFKPVEGGVEIATRNKETGKDEVKFVPSGETLTYENEDFKHVITIK